MDRILDDELLMKQLAFKELSYLRMTDVEPVKLSFAADTSTARQLKVMSRQHGVEIRELVKSAVQLMFTSLIVITDKESEIPRNV